MIWIRICFLCFIFIATSLRGQDANDILQKYFETVSNGNIKNWDTIKTVYIESEGFYSQENFDGSQPNFSGTEVKYSKTYRQWPDKLKTEIYADSTYSKLLSYTLWLGKKNKLIHWFNNMQPIIKPIKDVQWDFNPVHFFKLLKDGSVKFNGIKDFELDGISCFDIELQSQGSRLNLFINSTTYLLEYYKVFNPLDSSNYVKFDNYKKVDGFVVEMSYQSTSNGRVFHSSQKKRILFNHPIDPEVFKQPAID